MLHRIKRYLRDLKDAGARQAILTATPPADRELIGRIRARKLTYVSEAKLARIAETCRGLESTGRAGLFIEAGCALGGSAILIASLKQRNRSFFVYDVFEMIPPPTEQDTPDIHRRYADIIAGKSKGLGGDQYYGYMQNLYEIVQGNLREFGIVPEEQSVSLIRGRVEDTMQIDQPVAFAHVDVDWYQPVMTCLTRIFPNLIVGGSIILDDYHDWGGCRKATDEFLRGVPGQVRTDDSAGSMRITRTAPPLAN